jgi:hypothetical protein
MELVRKGSDSNRDRDVFRGEGGELAFPKTDGPKIAVSVSQ